MVAKIKSPHDLKRALNYNEQKVAKGAATCLHAENFLKPLDKMNFYYKLHRFENLIALNSRTQKTNTLHISLNFDPSEKLDKSTLINIGKTYMEKIGFAGQPYLIYEHKDAGHPHLHILTTTIQADGKRINTFNIAKDKSAPARIAIEKEFNLVKASGKQNKETESLKPINLQRVNYGKSETKRAITNVLDQVINQFKYTSLAELNAVLKQYNVLADAGKVGGRIQKHHGLQYSVLDNNGKKIGVPIKASSIYSKPTLKNLEKRFEENENLRQADKQKLKTAVDWVLYSKPQSLDAFLKGLQKEKVQALVRQNESGYSYGITFIDWRTKAVFNGSDLGKNYSIEGIRNRIGIGVSKECVDNFDKKILNNTQDQQPIEGKNHDQYMQNKPDENVYAHKTENLMDALLKQERNETRLPYQLLQKKKKKKRSLGL